MNNETTESKDTNAKSTELAERFGSHLGQLAAALQGLAAFAP